MSMFNSIKNNFLFFVFLCVFFVPMMVGAVEGDTSDNIINYSGGSWYSIDKDREVIDNTEGTKANKNLYSSNQEKVTLDNTEVQILRKKLTTGGSTFNIKSLTTQNVTVKNIGDAKTGYVSVFEFDPTPDNVKNNDAVILSAATKGGQFYIAKKPVKVETGIQTSTNSLTANGFLNMIDRIDGRPIGTTITAKNRLYNDTKAVAETQEKVVEAATDINKAWDDLQKAINRGEASSTVAQYQKAYDDALNNVRAAASSGNTAQKNLTESQKIAAASANPPATVDEYQCSWSSPLNCVLWTGAILANIVFKLTSFLAYVAGTLFDYSLEFSINSSQFLKKLGVVEITWSFIRDILNMTFIFILLWTAIQILITNDAKYNAKKILINVIIVAILMNFSLFAAKLMVDGSNVVSLKIYEAMKATDGDQKGSSISVRVMNTVGLSTLYNVSEIFSAKTIQAEGTCANNPVSLITVSVMGSIFLIVLILALGLAAILFLIRLVNIIMLFIKSPLWVWGYVIPGNAMMGKLKDDWQSQMKHVLLFPIAYLFWMLVSLIIFEKLGTVTKVNSTGGTNGGASLLDLICNPPGTVGIGQSISLVAIFVIVIIFMMKAVEYGVKHSGDGGSDAVGGKFATSISNKFGGYQTAMTKGLARKAQGAATAVGGLAVGASIGTAKIPLRAVTGLAGGMHSFRNNDGFWKGANDGFSNPSIGLKEMVGDVARNQAVNGGWVGDVTGVNKKAAALAKKYEDPVNSLGETRKKADERRTKSTVDHQENMNAAIDKKFKIPTQEEWEKKYNKGKKIVTDADAERFEVHINNIVQQRADATLGKGIMNENDDRDKPAADGSHMGKRSHLEIMKSKTIKRENVLDDAGNVIGKKVKFDELAMHDTMMNVLEYHTKGDGKAKENITDNKTRIETHRNIKAQAKIKAISGGISKSRTKAKKTDSEKTKRYEEDIKKTQEELDKIPDEAVIEAAVSGLKPHDDSIAAGGKGYDGKKLRDVNMAIVKYNMELARPGGPRPDKELEFENKIKDAKTAYSEHIKKLKSDVEKNKNELDAHIEALAEKERNK